MGNVLSGIPNVVSYLDEILVPCKDDAEHLKTLKAVFNQLQKNSLSADTFNNQLSIWVI